MQYILLTLLIGGVGTYLGTKWRLPAGAMVGAMIMVLIFNIITGNAYMPPEARKIAQIAAGALLGCRITRKDVYDLRKVILPAVILIFGMIVLNFSFGFIIHGISNLDLATSLFAAAPGGLSDMALIADELGADSPKVALLQLIRVISVLVIFPAILKYMSILMERKQKRVSEERGYNAIGSDSNIAATDAGREKARTANADKGSDKPKMAGNNRSNLFFTLCIAVSGGILGIWMSIPAGAMVVSMVAVVIFNLSCGRAYFPRSLRSITQTATGALIGSRMTGADVLAIRELIIPAIVMVVGMMVLTLIIGYTMHKFCHLDFHTALLASTPGGLQEITMIAEDVGADAPKVAVLHLFRLVSVISLFPVMLKYIYLSFTT